MLYRPSGGGPFIMVSGNGRRADDRSLCARARVREDVIGTPLAKYLFSVVDSVRLTEPRIEEVRKLDDMAHST